MLSRLEQIIVVRMFAVIYNHFMNDDFGSDNHDEYLAGSGVEMLVREIGEAIRGKVLNPGERLAPIRELARKYQVSFNAARAAVGRLETLGLVERRQGSGTYVRAQVTERFEGERNTVSLLLDINAHVFSQMASTLIERIQAQGLTATNAFWAKEKGLEGLQAVFSSWQNHPPRAIVVQWDYPGLDQAIEKARPADSIVIATFRGTRFMPHSWHSVNPDWYMAHAIAAEHLIQAGHKRIGFIGHERRFWAGQVWYDNKKSWMLQTDNIEAVGNVLRDAEIRDGLVICYLHHSRASSLGRPRIDMESKENLSRICQMLSEPNRPTALIGSDNRLVIAKQAAESLGLCIPQDLALLGIGNTPWSQAGGFPSVWEREDLAAKHIAELIESGVEGLSAAHHIVVPPVLSSTKA